MTTTLGRAVSARPGAAVDPSAAASRTKRYMRPSLVPFADEGLVERLPLALEPHGGRRHPLLAQRIDGHDVVAPRRLAGLPVGEGGAGDRLRRHPDGGLAGPAAVHAVDAVALQAALGVIRPLQ